MKELVLIDNNARTRVADLRMRSLPYLRADTAMYDLLKLFQTGRSHMVVLTKPPDAADGTVSRANSQDVTVQIEEAKERVSPEVNLFTYCTVWLCRQQMILTRLHMHPHNATKSSCLAWTYQVLSTEPECMRKVDSFLISNWQW